MIEKISSLGLAERRQIFLGFFVILDSSSNLLNVCTRNFLSI